MSETFFESPLYVYVTLVLAELVLGVIWYESRKGKWVLGLLGPPMLGLAVGLVEHFVVTDREQIVAAVEEIAEAVETRQLHRMPQHLDEQFTATLGGMRITKDEVVAVCNANVSKWSIREVNFHGMQVEITGREARMEVTTFLVYGREGNLRSSLMWDITWIKRQGRWLILDVAQPRHGFKL